MPIVPVLFLMIAFGYVAGLLLPGAWGWIGLGIGAVGFVALLLLALRPVSDAMLRRLEYRHPVLGLDTVAKRMGEGSSEAPSFVMVLGAGTRHYRPELPALGQLQPAGLARLAEAARLLHVLPDARLITCSFTRDDPRDQLWIPKAAAELGIDRFQVVSAAGRPSTRAELEAIKPIVGTGSFILVTSAAHMPRAADICEDLRLHPLYAPTDFMSRRRAAYGLRALRPTVQSLVQSERALYEFAAVLRARWSQSTAKRK